MSAVENGIDGIPAPCRRACRGHAPENTLAGIAAALRHGSDGIEVDLRCTRDGTPVLVHDDTVSRTTDGEGEVDELSLRQLRRLDAGGGERIPTLRELLNATNGRALLVLEIKVAGIEEAVLSVLRRSRALDGCVVHSFLPHVVKRFRRLEPRLPASLLATGRNVRDWNALFRETLELGANGIAIHHSAVTADVVRGANLRELRVSTWTANRRVDIRRVAACGVDAITSDYPDRARRWLPKR